jgi:Bacterial archaeo-eukaryotic release factor family 5
MTAGRSALSPSPPSRSAYSSGALGSPRSSTGGGHGSAAASGGNPAAGQAVSASGKDQYDQRLEANRERFLRRSGPLVGAEAERRDWRLVLAYGDHHEVEILGDADGVRLEPMAEANVIGESVEEVGRRVTDDVADLNRRRELELVERAMGAALESDRRGSLGLAPTLDALAEGRVEHLIFQGASRDREERTEAVAKNADDLIEGAVRTSAQITPVEGEAARALTPYEGVAALWRY